MSQEKRDSGQFTEDDDNDVFNDDVDGYASTTSATTANTTDKKRVTINHPCEAAFWVFF